MDYQDYLVQVFLNYLELHKLLTFLVNQTQTFTPTTTEVLAPLSTLLNRMMDIDFNIFNDRMSALEDYRMPSNNHYQPNVFL